jgi:two-component system, response regulator YesN
MGTIYRVLLIDDEFYVRKSIQNRVNWAKLGCEICAEAENGLRALELIEALKPEIVLVDIMMPEMDGLELIRRAKEISPLTQFAILSGYDDFLYTKEAIRLKVTDYIKKPVDVVEVEKAVREMIRAIDDSSQAMQRYIALEDQAGSLNEIKTGRALNDLCSGSAEDATLEGLLQDSPYAWVIVYTWAYSAERSAWDSEGVKAEIGGFLEQAGARNWYITANEADTREMRILLPVMSPSDSSIVSISEIAENLYQFLSAAAGEEIGLRLSVAYSQYAPASGLCEQYERALDALKGKVFLGGQGIQHPSLYTAPRQDEIHAVFSLLEGIKRCIVSRQLAKLDYLLNQLFLEKHFSSYRVLEVVLFTLVGLAQEYAIRYGVKLPEDYLQRMTGNRALLQYDSLVGVKEDVRSLLTYLLCDGCPVDDEHITTQVKKYIEENYRERIGLRSIAEEFYLNASYLSTLFKQRTGVNLNRYIESVRIERAKALLTHLDVPVNELAVMIGYGDPNYFAKSFRKRTGKTPLEYRASTRDC